MQSKITLRAMYNYDNTLFDNLQFPAGIDSDLAISRIINKSEEFEVLYADIDYMKDRIGIWGEIWNRTFKKWVDALSISYDPLFNYDRTEIYTDTHSKDYTDKHNKNYTDAHSKEYADNNVKNYADNTNETSESNSNTVTGSSSNSDTEQKHSAYDEADYSKRDKEIGSATTNQTGSGNASGSIDRSDIGSETNANSGNEKGNNVGSESNDTTGNSNEIMKHSARLFGNIGVTTSQQMLESELKIAEWNLYEHIADIFIDEFCILVY